jgi:F-type H+-transporting ATPase subunit alpha
LTPLGRGMNFLVIGPHGSGKTSLGVDAVLGQSDTGVKCIYASTANTEVELEKVMSLLKEQRALSNVAVIAASPEAPVGEKLATICAACSLGERVRDEKGHSLVVLDSVKPLSDAWNSFISGISGLGQRAALEGLIKDEQGRDVLLPITESNEELVDYQGMLVSGAVAQRRGFFSTLFMRPAKLTSTAGGGSMTLMPLVPGRCATGISQRVDMSKYQTLSEEQKAKIQVTLEKKEQEALQARIAEGEITTEVVEEFISIADGQVVLMDCPNSSGSYNVNPKLSITRVGSRAYDRAMADLAPQVRLDLAQAEDARKFSIDPDDLTKKQDVYTARLRAALQQPRSQPVALEDQIILLLAVQRGFANHVAEDELQLFLSGAIRFVHAAAFKALQELSSTKILTAASEKAIVDALSGYAELYREKELK